MKNFLKLNDKKEIFLQERTGVRWYVFNYVDLPFHKIEIRNDSQQLGESSKRQCKIQYILHEDIGSWDCTKR